MRLAVASIAAAIFLSSSTLASEQHDGGHEHHANASLVPIVITINPEARVSVTGGGALYRSQLCERPVELPVSIVNTGSVTTLLQARLVGSTPEGSSVTFLGGKLNGARQEQRMLRLTLRGSGFVEVTIAFRAKDDLADLDGRDRIHLLLECI